MSKPPKDTEISRRERQVLDALYRLGTASAAEIREEIENPPTYTTVRTHLANLEQKGFVKSESDGVRYIYQPTVPKDEMAKSLMHDLLRTFFENKVELVVSTLIDRKEADVSPEQLDEIAKLIERARQDGL